MGIFSHFLLVVSSISSDENNFHFVKRHSRINFVECQRLSEHEKDFLLESEILVALFSSRHYCENKT